MAALHAELYEIDAGAKRSAIAVVRGTVRFRTTHGDLARAALLGFRQSELIVGALKVGHGVHCTASDTHFIMKVAASRTAGRTHKADELPTTNTLARLRNQLGKVSV